MAPYLYLVTPGLSSDIVWLITGGFYSPGLGTLDIYNGMKFLPETYTLILRILPHYLTNRI